ncbi:unnamed protein product, partial [marine sediment metagenome]
DEQGKVIIAVSGITCITVLEAVALYRGINGQILSVVVGAIATIVGYAFGVTASKSE